jgi:hypothetical protein
MMLDQNENSEQLAFDYGFDKPIATHYILYQ